MKPNRLIRIVIDESVEPNHYVIGGVRVVNPRTDEELGRELRTTEVRVPDAAGYNAVRTVVGKTKGLELFH